ncbi:uncharacterized protein [Hyperolius riggenbachi]|uniref:uncharacterized protein isoform X1 n=1 Tax=Hyperolius riggenbachi TaxID=752182 RepID=UPI0035A2B2B0
MSTKETQPETPICGQADNNDSGIVISTIMSTNETQPETPICGQADNNDSGIVISTIMSTNETQPETPICGQADNNENLNTSNHGLHLQRKVSIYKENLKQDFILSGNIFIEAFKKLLDKEKKKEVKNFYMQRLLHSIFFFGQIYEPQIKPEEFIHDECSLKVYKNKFQEVFEKCQTHLACQSPYSILLEYMTTADDAKKPEPLKQNLKDINNSLLRNNKENESVANDFSASVIAYSCARDTSISNDTDWYYGASISYKDSVPRNIIISTSSLFVWDKAISYIVCCGDNGRGLTFPNNVQCCAYRFNGKEWDYELIPPCIKCDKMFNVQYELEYKETTDKQTWPYGNCAEVESLSNLLRSNENLRNDVKEGDNNGTRERNNRELGDNTSTMGRQEIERAFKDNYENGKEKELRLLLGTRGFQVKDQQKLQLFLPNQTPSQ